MEIFYVSFITFSKKYYNYLVPIMLIDSLNNSVNKSLSDSLRIIKDQTTFGTPLSRILILAGIVIIGSLLYLAYHRWVVPKNIKDTKKYEENSYKDIDGC